VNVADVSLSLVLLMPITQAVISGFLGLNKDLRPE
jgi:hypothetical protein